MYCWIQRCWLCPAGVSAALQPLPPPLPPPLLVSPAASPAVPAAAGEAAEPGSVGSGGGAAALDCCAASAPLCSLCKEKQLGLPRHAV
jgi:hypothetical protein